MALNFGDYLGAVMTGGLSLAGSIPASNVRDELERKSKERPTEKYTPEANNVQGKQAPRNDQGQLLDSNGKPVSMGTVSGQPKGVSTDQTETSQGGVAGFLGGKEAYQTYTADNYSDPNYAANKAKMAAGETAVANRPNQTMTGAQVGPTAVIDQAPQGQVRAQQMTLADQLAAQARGEGPSVAQGQLQKATDANLAAALAQGAAYRGGSPVGGFRQAAFNRAAITQDAANQSAQLRATEIQQARGQLGSVLDQTRGTDVGLATSQAGLDQQGILTQAQLDETTGQANLNAGVQQQQQKDEMVKFYTSQGLSLDEANKQAEIQQRQFNAGLLAKQQAAAKGLSVQSDQNNAQMGAAALGAIATIGAAASDKRVKKDVEPADRDVEDFLSALSAKKYKYTDPKYGFGEYLGIMAQDAEKTPMGKDIVFEKDGVKHVDLKRAFGAALASMAYLNKKVNKLERE